MRLLDEQAIEDIAVGAAVLGTGGGGDPYVGKLMALQALKNNGPIKMITLDELDDDAFVVPTAMMGAPTVLVEKVPSGKEIFNSVHNLEDYMGKKIDVTMPIEAGGVNSMIPLAVAASLGIPMIDADGMGRAFPELQMVTFHLFGVSACPMLVSDEKGNSIVFKTVCNQWTERIARAACSEMGGSVMDAIYPMSGAEVKKASIPGIVTLTEEIGKGIREAKEKGKSPIDVVLEITGGFEIFKGKVVDIVRKTQGGFVRGESHFSGIDEYKGSSLELNFQNENLVAIVDGKVACSTPDLIAVLDAETGHPITTEGLRYGARGVIIAMPCHEHWRTEIGIETAGPRYFGYDFDYTPVEELVAKNKAGE